MPDSSYSVPGTWWWSLLPDGLLLIPGGGALHVGGEGALVVLSPWEGDQIWTEISCPKSPL